jgi:hypothetical protein
MTVLVLIAYTYYQTVASAASLQITTINFSSLDTCNAALAAIKAAPVKGSPLVIGTCNPV